MGKAGNSKTLVTYIFASLPFFENSTKIFLKYLITVPQPHVLDRDVEPRVQLGLELRHRLVDRDDLFPDHLISPVLGAGDGDLDVGVGLHADVDQRVEVALDCHKLVVPAGLVLSLQVEPDEGALRVLPLVGGHLVAAVEDGHVGKPELFF